MATSISSKQLSDALINQLSTLLVLAMVKTDIFQKVRNEVACLGQFAI